MQGKKVHTAQHAVTTPAETDSAIAAGALMALAEGAARAYADAAKHHVDAVRVQAEIQAAQRARELASWDRQETRAIADRHSQREAGKDANMHGARVAYAALASLVVVMLAALFAGDAGTVVDFVKEISFIAVSCFGGFKWGQERGKPSKTAADD
jgi:hypothetical protein